MVMLPCVAAFLLSAPDADLESARVDYERSRPFAVLDAASEALRSEDNSERRAQWFMWLGLANEAIDEPTDALLAFFDGLSADDGVELPDVAMKPARDLFDCARLFVSGGMTRAEVDLLLAKQGLQRNITGFLCPTTPDSAAGGAPAPPSGTVERTREASPPSQSDPVPELQSQSRAPRTKAKTWPFWTSLSLAAAAAGAGTTTALLAQDRQATLNDGTVRPPSERADLIDEANQLNDVANISFIAAGVLGAVAVAAWIAPTFSERGRPLFVASPTIAEPGIVVSVPF